MLEGEKGGSEGPKKATCAQTNGGCIYCARPLGNRMYFQEHRGEIRGGQAEEVSASMSACLESQGCERPGILGGKHSLGALSAAIEEKSHPEYDICYSFTILD